MTLSNVWSCNIRRNSHFMRYIYIALTVWTLFILITSIAPPPQVISVSNKVKVVEKNIFERWYQSNRRNLLEETNDDFALDTQKFNNSGKHLVKLEDITQYYGKTDDKTKGKVFSILDSLMLDKNHDIPPVDCPGILNGDKEQILRGKLANLELTATVFEQKREKLIPSLERVKDMAHNCESFRKERRYITIPLSKEEAAYPIAYIITIHRDISSFERLLRTIYHPQNVYCVHVDSKSEENFKQVAKAVAECFDNVFVASNLTSVRYTHFSRVQADINCMQDLVKKADKFPWKYVINLCGLDFPLKTNFEIVRALKNLQGFNSLETFKTPQNKKKRYELHFDLPNEPNNDHAVMKRTSTKKSPPPHDIEMFAGSAYYVFKRKAVEYMLKDDILQEFFKWNGDTYSPDEHMWATIQRMFPQVPGSFPPHEKYDLNELQTITRIVKWGGLDKKVYPKCEGRFVRGICVFGCGDLAWLVTQKHLFANKFSDDVDLFAIFCLENWIRDRAIEQSKRYFIAGYL